MLVAGGSQGLTGAPCLSALAAARAGAGYVTACVPASLQTIFAGHLLEVMTRALPDEEGSLAPEGVETVLTAAQRGGALALGPGPRARRRGGRLRPPARRARAGRPRARRRRPQRARRAPGGSDRARSPDGLHPTRRRARPAAGDRQRAGAAPPPGARTATRPGAAAPSSCSRATTRSSSIPAAVWRSARAAVRRWRPPAPATCSPGVIAALLARGLTAFCRRGGGRLAARGGRAPGGEPAGEHRRGHRLRRDRCAARRTGAAVGWIGVRRSRARTGQRRGHRPQLRPPAP